MSINNFSALLVITVDKLDSVQANLCAIRPLSK